MAEEKTNASACAQQLPGKDSKASSCCLEPTGNDFSPSRTSYGGSTGYAGATAAEKGDFIISSAAVVLMHGHQEEPLLRKDIPEVVDASAKRSSNLTIHHPTVKIQGQGAPGGYGNSQGFPDDPRRKTQKLVAENTFFVCSILFPDEKEIH